MARSVQLFLLGATSGVATQAGPVGGGVRVLEALRETLPAGALTSVYAASHYQVEHSSQGRRVGLPVACLQGASPGRIIELSEWEYTRFSSEFEAVSTAWLLRESRPGDWVICNDISEGPAFAVLARAGLKLVCLFHILVVEFFCRMYLGGWLPARRLVQGFAVWDRLWGGRASPQLLRLVFAKEAEAVRHAHSLIVPSAGLGRSLLEIYGQQWADKLCVLPWSLAASPPAGQQPTGAKPGGEQVWLTLSRISWEKGLDVLLEALASLGPQALRVLICGEAAYMGGAAYLRKLRRQAARLPFPVEFPGYLTGERKRALLERADLFLSTSHYEAYGLTIEEALAAGVPVISLDHHGARQHAARINLVPGRKRRDRVRNLAAVLRGLRVRPPKPLPLRAASPLGTRLLALLEARSLPVANRRRPTYTEREDFVSRYAGKHRCEHSDPR